MLKHDVDTIKPGKQAGFTLIELLIVIAIIAILAAIAIPQFLKYKQGAYLDSVRSDIKNTATSLEAFNSKYGDYPTSTTSLTAGPQNLSDGTNTETDAVNISTGNTIGITYGSCSGGTFTASAPYNSYQITGYNANISSGPGSSGQKASYDSCSGQYSGF